MAPRKTSTGDAAPKAKKATATKKSADRVVKRPARGYHKFRNGLLNVTPKGSEKELAKINQKSGLLRLPPEIRNDIWKHVLGGKVFRAFYTETGPVKFNFVSALAETGNDMALLRTCRQIYAESAMWPLKLNTFSFQSTADMKHALRKLKPRQRGQIVSLQFEIKGPQYSYGLSPYYFKWQRLNLSKYLPGLLEIRIRIFSAAFSNEAEVQNTERRLRKDLEPTIRNMSAKLEVEQTELSWDTYEHAWKGTGLLNNEVAVPAEDQ